MKPSDSGGFVVFVVQLRVVDLLLVQQQARHRAWFRERSLRFSD
jgi:hypothetical protein